MPRAASKRRTRKAPSTGRLRIGDDWNAINIIALSQTNPLKSVAEFVENSIDANARNVTITRGRHRGETYLRVMDDGDGVPMGEDRRPDFQYVATHICDSIKRHQRQTLSVRISMSSVLTLTLIGLWLTGRRQNQG